MSSKEKPGNQNNLSIYVEIPLHILNKKEACYEKEIYLIMQGQKNKKQK